MLSINGNRFHDIESCLFFGSLAILHGSSDKVRDVSKNMTGVRSARAAASNEAYQEHSTNGYKMHRRFEISDAGLQSFSVLLYFLNLYSCMGSWSGRSAIRSLSIGGWSALGQAVGLVRCLVGWTLVLSEVVWHRSPVGRCVPLRLFIGLRPPRHRALTSHQQNQMCRVPYSANRTDYKM